MAKVIQCPCGYALRANEQREVVALAQSHAKEAHGMDLTMAEALVMTRSE